MGIWMTMMTLDRISECKAKILSATHIWLLSYTFRRLYGASEIAKFGLRMKSFVFSGTKPSTTLRLAFHYESILEYYTSLQG